MQGEIFDYATPIFQLHNFLSSFQYIHVLFARLSCIREPVRVPIISLTLCLNILFSILMSTISITTVVWNSANFC